MKIISRCGSKSEPRLTVLFNGEVNIVLEATVYHKRHVNDYINYRLLEEMWEE